MSCSIEEQEKIDQLMHNIAADAENRLNERIWTSDPVHYGFKKNRKSNNSKRPKPRKNKRK